MSDIYIPPNSSNRVGPECQHHRANSDGREPSPHRLSIKVRVTGRGEAEERDLPFEGRDAWALTQLLAAGNSGCTPIDNPAPRWSHYIFKLRRGGIDVETIHEAHGGPFAGHHARYVLRSRIQVLELQDPKRSHRTPSIEGVGNAAA